MITSKTFSIFAIALFLTSLTAQGAIEVKPAEYFICKHSKMVRTIHVVSKDGKTCSTMYTKRGVPRIVGTGRTMNGCQSFVQNIKGNLEGANWNCKKVKKASIENHVGQ